MKIKRKQKKEKHVSTGTRDSEKIKIVIIIIAKKFVNFTSLVANARTRVAKKDTLQLVNTGMMMGAIEKKDVLTSTRIHTSPENITKINTEVEALQEVAGEASIVKGVIV